MCTTGLHKAGLYCTVLVVHVCGVFLASFVTQLSIVVIVRLIPLPGAEEKKRLNQPTTKDKCRRVKKIRDQGVVELI